MYCFFVGGDHWYFESYLMALGPTRAGDTVFHKCNKHVNILTLNQHAMLLDGNGWTWVPQVLKPCPHKTQTFFPYSTAHRKIFLQPRDLEWYSNILRLKIVTWGLATPVIKIPDIHTKEWIFHHRGYKTFSMLLHYTHHQQFENLISTCYGIVQLQETPVQDSAQITKQSSQDIKDKQFSAIFKLF